MRAAEAAYRPVHDPLAHGYAAWQRDLTQLREKSEREQAERRRRAEALAGQEIWGYEVAETSRRVALRVFRTDPDHSGTRTADRAAPHRGLTAAALADELEPFWRAAGMIDSRGSNPHLGMKGYLLSSTTRLPAGRRGSKMTSVRWEGGVRASVEKATGLSFTGWWYHATGYWLLEGADLTRYVERSSRHFHAPYSSGGSF